MEPQDVPDENATVLYVGNLDKRVTEQMMLNILRTGLQHIKDKVLCANMFHNDMNSPEGYCFVQFENNNAACQAMTFLNGRDFCGKKVKVNWATNATPGGIPKVIGTSVSIYVGNLDETINEDDLKQAFEIFGEIINVKVVRDSITNKSKNIGFITFTNKPDAEKAIRDMHGAMLKTRPIKTNWATRNQNQKQELDYDEVYRETDTSNCTVYVGGIPANISDDQLRKHFDDYGKITDIRIFPAKNYAFIRFENHAAAATAICKTNGTELLGSCLKCWWGKEGPDGSSGGGGGGGSGYSNNSGNNYNSNRGNSYNNQDSSQYTNMTPQQQQQYMQQYMQAYGPYYQQQYYQYWMQQYQYQQQMMQQNAGGNAGQQQYPGYGQQQQQLQQQPQQQPQSPQQQQQQQQPPQQGGDQQFSPQSFQN